MLPDCVEDLESVVAKLDNNRYGRPVVVLCVGCFDLFHAGHLRLLQEAHRAVWEFNEWPYGNSPRRLVVAVNTDESVRALKGDGRPIHSLAQRAAILSALEIVNHVVAFEGNPALPIHALQPKLYVKGDDRSIDSLSERAVVEHYGGRIVIVPRLFGISTTETLRRINHDTV